MRKQRKAGYIKNATAHFETEAFSSEMYGMATVWQNTASAFISLRSGSQFVHSFVHLFANSSMWNDDHSLHFYTTSFTVPFHVTFFSLFSVLSISIAQNVQRMKITSSREKKRQNNESKGNHLNYLWNRMARVFISAFRHASIIWKTHRIQHTHTHKLKQRWSNRNVTQWNPAKMKMFEMWLQIV